jgi:hypothetical protein
VFGWMKTIGGQRKARYRGTPRVGWMFTLSAEAYNLIQAADAAGCRGVAPPGVCPVT